MPITGRSLEAAARTFCDHPNSVLTRTVTQERLVINAEPLTGHIRLSFRRQGRPADIPISTACGSAGLFITQVCTSEVINRRHHHRTLRYTY